MASAVPTSPAAATGRRESGVQHERKQRRGIALDRDLLCGLLHLAPRDRLAEARAAEGAVVLRRGRNRNRKVEAAAELVPPQRVVLRDAAADDERTRPLRPEREVREVGLVTELVDAEVAMVL